MPARAPRPPLAARRLVLRAALWAACAGLGPGAAAEDIVLNPGPVQTLPPNARIFKAPPAAAQPGSVPGQAAPPASPPPQPPAATMADDAPWPNVGGELSHRIQRLAQDSAAQGHAQASRIEVEVGTLDPRLRLAPCHKIEPYLPPGLPAWGRTRIGLKCLQGAKNWNVSLPLVVHVWRSALVLKDALPAGTVLQASHLIEAEVDLAAGSGLPLEGAQGLVGRTLLRGMAAGSPLRAADLKARQWFAAGETVKVMAGGPGWAIATEAQALNPGIEGQAIRVRTEAGKILIGRAIADRLVEVTL